MPYLLDTSVYSQPLRRKPMERALLRWRDAGDRECRVSMVSVAEVEWGLHRENQEMRWRRYRELLFGRLSVIDTTEDIWHEFARMKARQVALGARVADFDLLIASTAVRHRLVVATLDRTDFSRIEGVAWEAW